MSDVSDVDGVTVSTATSADGIVTVSVAGDVDLRSAEVVSKALARAQEESGAVLLDTRQVGFLGSVGLSILVDGSRRAAEGNGKFAVLVTGHTVRRAIEVTGLDSALSLFDSEDDAVRFLV